jgi:hypothetical protein
MGTWNTTMGDVVFIEHKQRTARTNRFAWMIDEATEARTARTTASAGRQLVTRVAGVVAALSGMLLAGAFR